MHKMRLFTSDLAAMFAAWHNNYLPLCPTWRQIWLYIVPCSPKQGYECEQERPPVLFATAVAQIISKQTTK